MQEISGMSMHTFAAQDVTASMEDTGAGVKSRMKFQTWVLLTPSSALRTIAAIVATALSGNAPFA
eukprot:13832-Pelagococcus_subviridis.AAC.2